MPGPDGESRAILYVVDTSEQKALESQFNQAQKTQQIGQLAGGVAHDFNNLLQVIIGNCDLLLMHHPAGDPSFAEINEVRQNSVRAAGLMRQLLALSRKQTLQHTVLVI
jgi:two-component system cell cycle sensor histidine kinase/response regulator CckA